MNEVAKAGASKGAVVAKVLDEYTIVLNKGSEDGLAVGKRFLIYELTADDIKDPESGESLGRLEIVKGTGKVVHVQSNLATVESDKTRTGERRIIRRRNPLFGAFGESETETITPSGISEPFYGVKVGDLAKPI